MVLSGTRPDWACPAANLQATKGADWTRTVFSKLGSSSRIQAKVGWGEGESHRLGGDILGAGTRRQEGENRVRRMAKTEERQK